MDKIDKRRFFIGLVLLLLGLDAVLSLGLFHNLAFIPFFISSIYFISSSKKTWRESFEDTIPEVLVELFYYPRLPYLQTFIAFLVFFGSLFFIPDFSGLIVIWLGVGVSQGLLAIFKKSLKSRTNMLMALKFQLFLFFSTFFWVHADGSLLFRYVPILPPILVLSAWMVMIVHIYLVLRS